MHSVLLGKHDRSARLLHSSTHEKPFEHRYTQHFGDVVVLNDGPKLLAIAYEDNSFRRSIDRHQCLPLAALSGFVNNAVRLFNVDFDDLKVVATGFQNVDAFVLCQSHYLAPTPRNDAILKLIADCLTAKDGYTTEEQTGVLSSFFLRKCRAARRSKWDSSRLRSIRRLAKLTASLCEKDAVHCDREFNFDFYSICHELILKASSFSSVSSAVKLTEIICCNYVNSDHADVDLEQRQLLLVIAFCHLKSISTNLEDLEALSFLFPSMLLGVSDNSTSDVVINQGLASALIDLLESSLASSKSCPKAEAIVKIFESHLLNNADISIYVAQEIDRCSDDLCSLYNTLDRSNARHAKTLLEVFYLLSVQKSNRSLLEKPAVFSLIWKSLNVSDSDDNIQCVAAELFASLTSELSKPFFGEPEQRRITTTVCQLKCSGSEFPQIARKFRRRRLTTATLVRITWGVEEVTVFTSEMVFSCLENDCSTLQLVFTLSTLTSFLLANDIESEVALSRIAKRLCSLEKDPRITNGYTKNLIENILH